MPLTGNFEFDVDRLIEAVSRTGARVVIVNSPNNPTGTPLADGAAERLLAETEALVVMDEAYQDIGGPTAVPLLAQHARLVVLRTFSKAMSLAGLRFGYALAHPAVAREIAKAKLPYNVNRVTLTRRKSCAREPGGIRGIGASGPGGAGANWRPTPAGGAGAHGVPVRGEFRPDPM